MAKLKWNEPPLYMPSSGSIVSVKFSMSSGLGKSVFIVEPRDNSERSTRSSKIESVNYFVANARVTGKPKEASRETNPFVPVAVQQ